MLRILHTSDWHLGQTLYEYSREWEHECFLLWLRTRIVELGVDVLLVSGDIFDVPNPSAASQRMFYSFLSRLSVENAGLQVIITAGNHDSAGRLEAPDAVLESLNVVVRGSVRRLEDGTIDHGRLIIPLRCRGGSEVKGWCIAVPYLRQGDCPVADGHAEGVRLLYEELYAAIPDKSLPVVAMGHLHATGSTISRDDPSERTNKEDTSGHTNIGGIESVPPSTFPSELSYVALGHLHRAQRVGGLDHVRYAGAPLPMSFSEKDYHRGVTLIKLTEAGTTIDRLAFEAPVKLLSIPLEPQPLPVVLEELSCLPEGEITESSPIMEIKILQTEPEPSMRQRIEGVLVGKSVRIGPIRTTLPSTSTASTVLTYDDMRALNPMDIALSTFRHEYNNEMPASMRELLQSVINDITNQKDIAS